jgi:CspA family cold shock protein
LQEDSPLKTGTVKWFNSSKGYGFLNPVDGGFDVFVHISAVERAGIAELTEGQKIIFDIVTDARTGHIFADKLSVLPDSRVAERGGPSEPPQPTPPFVGRLMGQIASRIGARRET